MLGCAAAAARMGFEDYQMNRERLEKSGGNRWSIGGCCGKEIVLSNGDLGPYFIVSKDLGDW